MEKNCAVGKRVPLRDAFEKVTGRALYTGDMTMPRMLHGQILRSPCAHAKVLHVDTSRAEKLHGVKAVLSKNNAPGVKVPVSFGVPSDKVAFGNKVRYVGDEVAVVAAVSKDAAKEAVRLIRVEYEELPAIFDAEKAVEAEAPIVHDDKPGNIAFSIQSESGNVDAGFRQADYIFEDTFRTSSQRHASMETHSAIASFDSNGKLTVWSSTQIPFLVQRLLAEYLDIPMSRVRVIKPHFGGGFGGKLDMLVEHICALLSRMTGRPVKLVLSREEEFFATVSRHQCIIRLKVGAKKDGSLIAIETHVISNEGAYLYKTGPLNLTCKIITETYRCPNTRFEAHGVYTNTMSGGAYRGYGNPQGTFAIESMMDRVAERVGIDPVEFRIKNYKQTGDIGYKGMPINVCGLADCLERGKKEIGWGNRRKPGCWAKTKKRGVGMACFTHATGTTGDYSSASIRINADGTALLFVGVADLGTGCNTTLAQIAAEGLCLNLDAVNVIAGDTDTASFDRGAFASKTLYDAGNAVKGAVEDVKKKIVLRAAEVLQAQPETLEFKDGQICVKGVPGKMISYGEIVTEASSTLGKNTTFIGEASFENTGFPQSFGAQFAEVEVDIETGEVACIRIVNVQDNGRSINPMVVEGQIEGALHHSVGQSLTEDPVLDKDNGKMLNPDFANYMVLTTLDMPNIKLGSVETYEPSGPFGAKGMAELPVAGTAAAIANAVYNGIGIRFTELPITPEKVFRALKGM
jgi:xanthine dehydrogenase molybdenum-binding subunit